MKPKKKTGAATPSNAFSGQVPSFLIIPPTVELVNQRADFVPARRAGRE
jgi:hypothetical protein